MSNICRKLAKAPNWITTPDTLQDSQIYAEN
jgi:hypothetical protein